MNAGFAKEFEEKLIQLINTCNLPIETAYYIVKNQVLELELLYNNIIYSDKSQTPEVQQEQVTASTDILLDPFVDEDNNITDN